MKKTPNWESWSSGFIVMILVPNMLALLRQTPPVNARAAIASLAFRIICTLIGIIGLVTIHILKKGAEKARSLEGESPSAKEATGLSERDAIVLPYQSTKESMWRCEKWALLHRWEHLTPLLFLGGVSGILLGAVAHEKLNVPAWLGVSLGIPVGITGWALFILMFSLLGIETRLSASGGVRKLESVITHEGLIERRPEGTSYMPWSSLKSFQFHKGDIYFLSGMQGIYIPREAFETTAEAERLFTLLTALHTSNGERWPEFAPRPNYDLE